MAMVAGARRVNDFGGAKALRGAPLCSTSPAAKRRGNRPPRFRHGPRRRHIVHFL